MLPVSSTVVVYGIGSQQPTSGSKVCIWGYRVCSTISGVKTCFGDPNDGQELVYDTPSAAPDMNGGNDAGVPWAVQGVYNALAAGSYTFTIEAALRDVSAGATCESCFDYLAHGRPTNSAMCSMSVDVSTP